MPKSERHDMTIFVNHRWPVAAAAGGMALSLFAATACASSADTDRLPPVQPTQLQAAIALRSGDGAEGVLGLASSPDKRWAGSSGDLHSGKPIDPDAHFRIGSISKTFEAALILKLVAQRRMSLDATVQHYAPGMLPASYAPITVRELLDHTSGLPATQAPAQTQSQVIADRFQTHTLTQLIQADVRPAGQPVPPLQFTPGSEQHYNSINYRVAARLVEIRTGHSYPDELTHEILRPARLRHTKAVRAGQTTLPTPYLHAYYRNDAGQLVDVSRQAGDASSIISTPADLDQFITELFGGHILNRAALGDMFTLPNVTYVGGHDCSTGPTPGQACYSLGLQAIHLADGTTLWGKTGHDLGYTSGILATRNLHRIAVGAVADTTAHTNDAAFPAPLLRLTTAAFGPLAS